MLTDHSTSQTRERAASRPRVGIVVLNWRLVDATLALLDDLTRVEFAPRCTLLIDNGSNDGSAERLRAYAATATRASGARDDLELELLPDNLGYCAAIAHGVAWSARRGVDYLLLLNNDVRVPSDFLDPLVAVLDCDPSVGAVGPTVVDPSGRVWSQGGSVVFGPNLVALRGQGRDPAPREHGPEAVDFLPGACVLVRCSALAAVGGIDEDFFMYWEDVDLGARLRAHGLANVWLPWVRVVHDASASSGGGRSPLRKYMMAVNSVRYLRRHGRTRGWVAFWLFECLLWPLTLINATGPRAAIAKARGLIAGLRGRHVTIADVERYAGQRRGTR